ncbi:hypothetical protein BC830DRAFT_1230919 [Chytriomyces sp. MP71]|nr:hypothetical protein BC830DRAFT_1230919 [Chytriomyces sp. MP71]
MSFPDRNLIETSGSMTRRGRKPATTPPTTVKMGQVREAQRKFQEKRRLFVEGLQDQVSELAAGVSRKAQEVLELKQQMAAMQMELGQWRSLGGLFPGREELLRGPSSADDKCARCQTENLRAEFYQRQIKALEARFGNVQEELESIKASKLIAAEFAPFNSESALVTPEVMPDLHAFMSIASMPCSADMSALPLTMHDQHSLDVSLTFHRNLFSI